MIAVARPVDHQWGRALCPARRCRVGNGFPVVLRTRDNDSSPSGMPSAQLGAGNVLEVTLSFSDLPQTFSLHLYALHSLKRSKHLTVKHWGILCAVVFVAVCSSDRFFIYLFIFPRKFSAKCAFKGLRIIHLTPCMRERQLVIMSYDVTISFYQYLRPNVITN